MTGLKARRKDWADEKARRGRTPEEAREGNPGDGDGPKGYRRSEARDARRGMPTEEARGGNPGDGDEPKGYRSSEARDARRGGTPGPIGREDVARAEEILQKYKQGKASLDATIVKNEQWYKLRNWEEIGRPRNPGDPQPTSAWLFNSIVNKHADAMDNYPQPNVLPREKSDEEAAGMLSAILPTVLDNCDFERVYSNAWWYKLKHGTGVYGVFWNSEKENGLGDIDICDLDILNLFWEPGIKDIQKSANLFHVELKDREELERQYPQLKDKLGRSTLDVAKYRYDDTVDDSDKAAVVDWYYRRRDENGKILLHYCKFCMGEVLYASENDPQYSARGYYDHGKYPVVMDVLFPVAGSPAGFGYVNVCRSPQMYIDKLDQALLKNAVMGARPRFWARNDGGVNEQEYADLSKDFVHYSGSANPEEYIRQITVPQVGAYAMAMRTAKIDELKETSSNRDFQQGGTSGGITAASAISALQEAGSKTSRDMIKASYRAQAEIGYLCIDLIRQFYTEPRKLRIVGENGRPEYVTFAGGQIGPQPQGTPYGVEMGERVPVFDIKVSAQKASPFATVAQNERAKELYGLGFFRPDMADQSLAALELMQFDGIEKVRERIGQNGTLQTRIEQMSQIMMAMAQELDARMGTQYLPQVAQLTGQALAGTEAEPGRMSGAGGDVGVNALGDTFRKSQAQTAAAARNDAAGKSTPK